MAALRAKLSGVVSPDASTETENATTAEADAASPVKEAIEANGVSAEA